MTEFYAPMPVERKRRPGSLLRTQPVSVRYLSDHTRAWRIAYVSNDSRGERIPVTGTVITSNPVTESATTPIVVYCTSFHGLGGECAPSQQLVTGGEALDQIQAVLDQGWMVAIPDGENLGIPGLGPHTFLASRAAAHVTLDLARAAQALSDSAHVCQSPAPIVLWGYGDGGRAAVWAGEHHRAYAPDLDLRGIAAGAVVSDPGALVRSRRGGPWSALALAGLIGLSRAYHHLPLRHILTEDGLRVAQQAETLSAAVLLDQFRQPLEHWCKHPYPWDDPVWRYVLTNESRSGAGAPEVPVHLYHGSADRVVPVESGSGLFGEYQRRGVSVSWCEYDANHFRAAIDSIPDVMEALAGFLQGPRTSR
ncbi:lipase family protein [Nocardia sp. NPDC056000]|uniref:lipase family protein n=1 Tax=Nocardia sp. NPDC056000 TaxID=3345674 RepID=UPI0035E2C9F0